MRSYRLYPVDVFTGEVFRGNPAGVVPDAHGLTEAQRQAIGRPGTVEIHPSAVNEEDNDG